MAAVLCGIDPDRLGEKEEGNVRVIEAEDQKKNKSEKKQRGEDEERPEGIQTCEVLIHSVLGFGMDHTKNLKVEDIKVLLRYHFRSENMKGIPKKLELVEAVTEFLEIIGRFLCRGRGVGYMPYQTKLAANLVKRWDKYKYF